MQMAKNGSCRMKPKAHGCELALREVGMSCLSCGSKKQAEFSAEMLIHFVGFKNLDKPGVWLFPALLVCLDCGFLQSTIPASRIGTACRR